MKQTIRKSPAKKLLSSIAVSCSITAAGMLAGCSSSDNSAKEDIPVVNTSADLVVYGKIFTSESGKIVEAFAVKDGKYVYVGDKKGAEVYVEAGKTEVVDYTDKGLVMPGCGNGHSHYMLGYALKSIGTLIGLQDDSEKLLKEIVPAAVKKARAEGATSIFAQGWRLQSLEANMPTRLDLDAICSDIPIYLLDEECHKALANTILLKKAGIIKEDGTAGRTTLRGGEIVTDADGMPTGLLKEQAQTYVRSFLDNDNLYTLGKATANLAEIEQYMHSVGYTMYCEGWGNYFVNTNYYQAAQAYQAAH